MFVCLVVCVVALYGCAVLHVSVCLFGCLFFFLCVFLFFVCLFVWFSVRSVSRLCVDSFRRSFVCLFLCVCVVVCVFVWLYVCAAGLCYYVVMRLVVCLVVGLLFLFCVRLCFCVF